MAPKGHSKSVGGKHGVLVESKDQIRKNRAERRQAWNRRSLWSSSGSVRSRVRSRLQLFLLGGPQEFKDGHSHPEYREQGEVKIHPIALSNFWGDVHLGANPAGILRNH